MANKVFPKEEMRTYVPDRGCPECGVIGQWYDTLPFGAFGSSEPKYLIQLACINTGSCRRAKQGKTFGGALYMVETRER